MTEAQFREGLETVSKGDNRRVQDFLRLAGPGILALAVLALRARVKR